MSTRTNQPPFSPFGFAKPQFSIAPFGLPQPTTAAPFGLPQPLAIPAAPPVAPKTSPRDSFERRFLSECYRGGVSTLEIAMMWKDNLFHVDQYEKAGHISIGASAEATYAVEAACIGDLRPFVTGEDSQWTLTFNEGMDGFLLVDPRTTGGKEKLTLQEAITSGLAQRGEGGWTVRLTGTTRAKLVVGGLTFLVHNVSRPTMSLPLLALGGSAGAGLLVSLLTFGVSFLLHSGFWFMVSMTTDRINLMAIDQLNNNSAFAEALVAPDQQEEELEEEEEAEAQASNAPEEEDGARAAEEEGDSGRPDETTERGRFAIAGDEDHMALARAYDTEVARGSGVLAAAAEMESLLGTGMTSVGYDAVDAWGDFDARNAYGNAPGNYGLGMKDAGRGGGGNNRNGFGFDGFSNSGRPGGGDGGRVFGEAKPKLGEKETKVPTFNHGRPDVNGSLDKRIIRKVVNQHHSEIKACYQKELATKSSLYGKIVVKWTIDGSGNVATALVFETTMNNQNVERCLANAIEHWRFPAPKNGTLVSVSYPFVFEVK